MKDSLIGQCRTKGTSPRQLDNTKVSYFHKEEATCIKLRNQDYRCMLTHSHSIHDEQNTKEPHRKVPLKNHL